MVITGSIDLLIGLLTSTFPYFTLKTIYGYNPIFDDPDPTWSSYKYGYLNVLTILSSSAQMFVALMFFVLVLEQFCIQLAFLPSVQPYLTYVFTSEVITKLPSFLRN